MTLYMQSTKIEAEKTVAEISALLGRFGARSVMHEFDEFGDVTGVSFTILLGETRIPYKLPARIEPVHRAIQMQRSVNFRERKKDDDWQQARRVAWRQILRWIQAQIALIDTGMVSTAEVMSPWIRCKDGRMLFEHICTDGLGKLLPATV